MTVKIEEDIILHDNNLDDDDAIFHIYNDGCDVALCGHELDDDGIDYPFVRGIYDCQTCWEIHLAEEAEGV